jgi:hypothetical protein
LPWILAIAALPPLLFIGWEAVHLLRNAPFQDEFATVLDFLLRARAAHGWHQWIAILLAQENEHRIVTSRLIFLALRGLTGGVNFVTISVLGDLFLVGAIAVIACQLADRTSRLLAAALLILVTFQLEHYESLFLSYASIDHFHIVLLAAASLAFLHRPGAARLAGAILFALLASLTLAHGLAVFAAGAVLLAVQRRWRALPMWLLAGAVTAAAYLHGLADYHRSLPSLATLSGAGACLRFWLALLGGVPALGWAGPAPVFGLGALVLCGWLLRRGALRAEPFLGALLIWVLCSTAMISFGRFGLHNVPPSSSRYMIQSALLWAVSGLIGVRQLAARPAFPRAALLLVAGAALFSAAADVRFYRVAHTFLGHRDLSLAYYGRRGTLRGAPYPLYPQPAVADRLLAGARLAGIYNLHPSSSLRAKVRQPVRQQKLDYFIDELTVGVTHVFVRGWVLPPLGRKAVDDPFLVLAHGNLKVAFQGTRVSRPDVARLHGRPDASLCGFRFNVPRSALPEGELNLSLALVGWEGSIVTQTLRQVENVSGGTYVAAKLP